MGKLRRDDPRVVPVAQAIADAIAKVENQIGRTVFDEEPITERLAARIENAVESLPQVEGARWSVRAIESDKRTENQHGADLGVIIDVELPRSGDSEEYEAHKGVVLQMKKLERLSGELGKLRRQCRDMERLTSAAGAAILNPKGSTYVPAKFATLAP